MTTNKGKIRGDKSALELIKVTRAYSSKHQISDFKSMCYYKSVNVVEDKTNGKWYYNNLQVPKSAGVNTVRQRSVDHSGRNNIEHMKYILQIKGDTSPSSVSPEKLTIKATRKWDSQRELDSPLLLRQISQNRKSFVVPPMSLKNILKKKVSDRGGVHFPGLN